MVLDRVRQGEEAEDLEKMTTFDDFLTTFDDFLTMVVAGAQRFRRMVLFDIKGLRDVSAAK